MAPQRYVYNVHDVISCLNFILLLLSTLLVYRGIRISIISLIANIIKNLIFQTFPERQNPNLLFSYCVCEILILQFI